MNKNVYIEGTLTSKGTKLYKELSVLVSCGSVTITADYGNSRIYAVETKSDTSGTWKEYSTNFAYNRF